VQLKHRMSDDVPKDQDEEMAQLKAALVASQAQLVTAQSQLEQSKANNVKEEGRHRLTSLLSNKKYKYMLDHNLFKYDPSQAAYCCAVCEKWDDTIENYVAISVLNEEHLESPDHLYQTGYWYQDVQQDPENANFFWTLQERKERIKRQRGFW